MDKVVEVLKLTNDGKDLSPRDLFLVELMINGFNGNDTVLSAKFDELYDKVVNGRYNKLDVYLYGIPHLTRDHQGYILWKGSKVEHYSYDDVAAEKAAAEHLAKHCAALEAKGFPVNMRTSTDDRFLELDAANPWVPVLLRFYTVMQKDESFVAIVHGKGEHDNAAIVVCYENGSKTQRIIQAEEYDSGLYLAFHAYQDIGYRSTFQYGQSYLPLIAMLEKAGIIPEDFDRKLEEDFS